MNGMKSLEIKLDCHNEQTTLENMQATLAKFVCLLKKVRKHERVPLHRSSSELSVHYTRKDRETCLDTAKRGASQSRFTKLEVYRSVEQRRANITDLMRLWRRPSRSLASTAMMLDASSSCAPQIRRHTLTNLLEHRAT